MKSLLRCGHLLPLIAILLPLFCGLLLGCADTNRQPSTQPVTVRDRQEHALRDPFGYGPTTEDKGHDISGGGLTDFDREGFRRDVDRVLNP
jgi:hypothetical protein